MIIIANLPYLSKTIYDSIMPDVKNFEPRSALYSPKEGLAHYERLVQQIKKLKKCSMLHVLCFMEFSPEQKPAMEKLLKRYLPEAKSAFAKDLAGKWRVAKVAID
jgi:release factor glutamine methyltransferase